MDHEGGYSMESGDANTSHIVDPTTDGLRQYHTASGRANHCSSLVRGLAEVNAVRYCQGTIRLPWVDDGIMEMLQSNGVQIAEEAAEAVELDLEAIRDELMELIRSCRGKELHRYMCSSPELEMLTALELKELVESLDFEAQAA